MGYIWSCRWEGISNFWKDQQNCRRNSKKVFNTKKEARTALETHAKKYGHMWGGSIIKQNIKQKKSKHANSR